MDGEVLRLPTERAFRADDLRGRLKRMASILKAIEAGELLSALPGSPAACANHLAAVDLLTILGEELNALTAELA
jgi:hypothetical protein